MNSNINDDNAIDDAIDDKEKFMDKLSQTKLYESTPICLRMSSKSGLVKYNNVLRNSFRGRPDILLNERFDYIDRIPKLKTILYPHQKTAVRAMIDLEMTRTYTCSDEFVDNENYKIVYNAAVLSEPVGSGKTIDILAVISSNKIPRVFPDIMELKLPGNFLSVGYTICKFKKILTPTIIFVGVSVIKQWENAIKTFTTFKYYTVNNVNDLKELFNMMVKKIINKYDIILVKNGKITVPIKLPFGIKLEDKNRVAMPYIYNLIANLYEYCWARVVIDDFDTIKLPKNATIIRGLFTWYISSTRKGGASYHIKDSIKCNRTSELLQQQGYGCSSIMHNDILFNKLNVCSSDVYIKDTMQIPIPKFHVITFKNPNDRYISILGFIADDDAKRVVEMLNGDAFGEAAELAGIKSSSVSDIFNAVLGGQFQTYRFAGDLLEFITYQYENENKRATIPKNVDLNFIDEDGIKIYRYGKHDLLKFRDIEYKFPGVNDILYNTEQEYKEIKTQTGLSIQRVKDNIKHGECPVCRIDLSDVDDVIIMKCCNAIFCSNCGILANNLKDKMTGGRCSNCRAIINIKDLIYIGNNIKLQDIVDENLDDSDDSDEKEMKELIKIKQSQQTKYTTIIDIINGEIDKNIGRVDLNIPNMMKGSSYLPESSIRKVLIFASFDETLKNVMKELTKNNITFWKLQGGSNEINKITTEFTNYPGTCAMIINSTRHCSGLNLQFTTDLIFTHRMTDQNIESQVVGRGHRIGRTSPLNIWYLLYDNEHDELASTHNVRELSNEELIYEHDMEARSTVNNV
jgi:hypothetical protein